MSTIYIRNVPEALARKVRSQAAAMGLTLAEWLGEAAEAREALEWIDFHTSDNNARRRSRIVLGLETSPKGKE